VWPRSISMSTDMSAGSATFFALAAKPNDARVRPGR
jgi:hypothetical protein